MTDFFKITMYGISSNEKFGLCENASKLHTYLDESNDNTWLSTVVNPDESERRFIPVKDCLKIDVQCDDVTELCHGVIIFTDNLVFIELRNTRDGFDEWLKSGVNHLKNTIKIFKNNHNIDNFQSRVAYLAYKTRRRVPTVNNNLKNKFVLETGIQLYVDHEITV